MKSNIKYILSLFAAVTLFSACEEQNTPDPVRTQYPGEQSPIIRDNAYYARLRAYKLTKHPLSFGWYGSWTAIGSSEQTRLTSAPDSMDIISMWSQWHSLNQDQIADKAFVQKTKGTKVVFCISARDVPEEFKEDGNITDASLVAYAKAWGKDSMDKYEYDGMDIDFETAIDHQGPLNTTPGLFKKFCVELSKYIGPNSGTGRLFLIDGNIDALDQGIAELCNYGVSQAYNCSGSSNLHGRISSAATKGWTAEQLIFTENFESLWQKGGVNFTNDAGVTLESSLIGMAEFAAQGKSAGFGTYHMEYEYGFKDMPYKYMRRGIQLANPAPLGDYTKNLLTINEAGEVIYKLHQFPSGKTEVFSMDVTASLTGIAPGAVSIPLKVENSLVDKYNDYYYTEYLPLDASVVTFSAPLQFATGEQASTAPVSIIIEDGSALETGKEYLVPVCADFSAAPAYSANTSKQTIYLLLSRIEQTTSNSIEIAGYQTIETATLAIRDDDSIEGDIVLTVTARQEFGTDATLSLPLTADASLVAAYNQANGTAYTALAADNVSISNNLDIAAGLKSSSALVTVKDLSKVPNGFSMIALQMDTSGLNSDYATPAQNKTIKYILITKGRNNIEEKANSVDGALISDMTGWTYTRNGADQGNMFNGNTTETGWYTTSNQLVVVNMTKPQTLAGLRLGVFMGNNSYKMNKLYNIQTSQDGVLWEVQMCKEDVALGDVDADKCQFVKFIKPVTCQYVRMSYDTKGANYGNLVGSNEFNGIAPKN